MGPVKRWVVLNGIIETATQFVIVPTLNNEPRLAIKESVGECSYHAAKEKQEKEAKEYIRTSSIHYRSIGNGIVELELGDL